MIKISPMQIVGEWTEGYALDIHIFKSIFLGHDEYGHPQFDNIRSEMGELVYRLKYRSDKSVIPTISETAAIFIKKAKLESRCYYTSSTIPNISFFPTCFGSC